MLSVSEAWKVAYPGAAVGALAMRNVSNPAHHPALDKRIGEFEAELRARFQAGDRAALRALPTVHAYTAYYKRYKKTYHVQLQLESFALRGKALPRTPALVGAMVMTELKHLLLTAGHDLEAIQPPVTVDVATGRERYKLLGGPEQELKGGDMMMADARGVISCVLYGPDRRTCITAETRRVLFAVYAPPGIGEPAVAQHLEDLRATVLLFAPEAQVEALEIHGGRPGPGGHGGDQPGERGESTTRRRPRHVVS